ncbi:hypothetical protein LOAG_13271 [Loa loa]|uniref:Uncharacterized protein n=1 Tax=Loa loa TaxID=7209 RepID=A0A1S0TJS8_LOALO|nr:hypothetical protein LOAG_13271 [Loa loa]EFO15238.2 hypothetical protein LOAG_13271 [Loa loa]
MASGDKQSDQQKKTKKHSDKQSTESSKEAMATFMTKVCARLEKIHLMSRLLEEPEEKKSQKSMETKSKKTKKSQEISKNVYEFFCDQPSTSEQSDPKLASKKKSSDSHKPSTSNITTSDQKELNKDAGVSSTISTTELSTSTHSSTFDENENPNEPSTSTGLRKSKIDDEEHIKPMKSTNSKQEQIDTEMSYKPKLSSLYGIHKKTHLGTPSDITDNTQSITHKSEHSKQTVITSIFLIVNFKFNDP